jgi:predicted DNA-binding protein (UPF0251 family)
VRLSQEKHLTVKDSGAMMGISKLTLDAYVRQSQGSAPGAHHAAR